MTRHGNFLCLKNLFFAPQLIKNSRLERNSLTMKLTLTKFVTLCLGLGLFSSQLVAKTETKMDHKMDPKMAAMHEAMIKAATPGEAHMALQPMIGKWNVTTKTWMNGPKGEVIETTGKAKNSWTLGKRFMMTEYEGSMNGEDYEGFGYTGYNNMTKRYEGNWMQTACTSLTTTSGTMDKTGKILTMKGNMTDPMGKAVKARMVTTIISNDEHKFEMFMTEPGKKETKMMEMTYIRRGTKRS